MLSAILVLGWPCAGSARAQATDEEEREKIEAPAVPDASGKRPDLARAAPLGRLRAVPNAPLATSGSGAPSRCARTSSSRLSRPE